VRNTNVDAEIKPLLQLQLKKLGINYAKLFTIISEVGLILVTTELLQLMLRNAH
jgi:hypothetical protein